MYKKDIIAVCIMSSIVCIFFIFCMREIFFDNKDADSDTGAGISIPVESSIDLNVASESTDVEDPDNLPVDAIQISESDAVANDVSSTIFNKENSKSKETNTTKGSSNDIPDKNDIFNNAEESFTAADDIELPLVIVD